MAIEVITNAKAWLGAYDVTGIANALALNYAAELQDATVFSQAARARLAGLKTIEAQINGFFDPTIEAQTFANIGLADVPLTLCPAAGAEGDRAFSFRAVEGQQIITGKVGEVGGFEANANASQGPLVRGQIFHNAARIVTANGNGIQLGLVGAGKSIYAALHVLAVSGTATPTLTVKLQSDDNSGFTTAIDRITFTAATAITSEWKSLAGAIASDDYWRFVWTISGTNPSFTFVAFAGIL